MTEDADEGKLFISFEKSEECLHIIHFLIPLDLTVDPSPEDDQAENAKLWKLERIVRVQPQLTFKTELKSCTI